MKKTIILATILTLLFIPIFSIYSQTKVYDNETVYVLSDPYGNFKDKIVVDWIRVRGSGDYEIKDPIDELVDVKKDLWRRRNRNKRQLCNSERGKQWNSRYILQRKLY